LYYTWNRCYYCKKKNDLVIPLTLHFRSIYRTTCPEEYQQQQSAFTNLIIPCQTTELLHIIPKQIEPQHLSLFKWLIEGLEGDMQ